jgi:hypothetical protein
VWLACTPLGHGAAGLERRPSVERLDSKAASDQVPFALAPDFLKSKPGIISLIPGAAVAGDTQATARAARKGEERSVPCVRARRCQRRAEDERRSGSDVLIPGEPEHLARTAIFRLT